MPCKDNITQMNRQDISILTSDPISSKAGDLMHDQCSPFCQCSCCNTPTISSINEILITMPFWGEKAYFELLPEKVITNLGSIWQPPKLLS